MLLFFQFFFLRTHLFPEDLRELRVSEGEGPEAEVGRRVADHPEHELDGLNGLVDDDLAEVVLFVLQRGQQRGMPLVRTTDSAPLWQGVVCFVVQ